MKNNVISPLTGKPNVTLVDTFSINELKKMYLNNYDLKIDYLLQEQSDFIYRYRCEESGLEFFYPNNIIGDSEFYNKLQQKSWYYVSDKWEFHEAINEFPKVNKIKILEIGCAKGDFLNLVKQILPDSDLTGLELNKDAIIDARKKGLNVLDELSSDHLLNNHGKYDVVVSFQVLEHIANPLDFLNDSVKMLKPGGKLIIGVPDNSRRAFPSIIVKPNTDLNMPPHHQGLWNIKSLFYLSKILPISLEYLSIEPAFSISHKNTYRLEVKNSLIKRFGRFFGFAIYAVGLPYIKYTMDNICKYLPGHTVLAVYKKNNQ